MKKLALGLWLLAASMLGQNKISLFNRILATPSAATGDLYYTTNAGGIIGRLPAGGTGTFLGIAGGIPAWTNLATSLGIVGTAGAGYITLVSQSSNPAAPPAGTLLLHSSTLHGFTRMEQDNEAATNLIYSRDTVFIAKNTSGGTINPGQPVYVNGSTGNVPNVTLAKANSTTTLPAVGVALDAISNNAFGQVMALGVINNIDTSAFTTGARLFVSATTAGVLTATDPVFPNYRQRIGWVLVSGVGNGSILVTTAPFIGGQESGTDATLFSTAGGTNIVSGPLQFNGNAGTLGQCPISNGTGALPSWGNCATGTGTGTTATPVWSWSNVTASRTGGTVYQNTSSFPMLVIVECSSGGSIGSNCEALSDASNPPTTSRAKEGFNTNAYAFMVDFLVLPSHYYKVVNTAATVAHWTEYAFNRGTLVDSGDLSGSRSIGTAYQNTSGGTMFVGIQLSSSGTTAIVALSDTANPPTTEVWGREQTSGNNMTTFFPVPNNSYYKITNVGGGSAVVKWYEYALTGVTVTKSASLAGRPIPNTWSGVITSCCARPWQNVTGKSLLVIHVGRNASTGTILGFAEPTVGDTANVISSVVIAAHSFTGNAAYDRPLVFGINPGEYYVISYDGGTATVGSWFEWTLE